MCHLTRMVRSHQSVRMPQDAPLTITQVATRLGCSRWTVLRLIQDEKLASTQLANGTHLIDPAEFGRYVSEQRAAAVARFDEAAS